MTELSNGSSFLLKKASTVHLKPEGEICNRLNLGTRVVLMQQKGEWGKINWRSGKKKGWIRLTPHG